MILHASTMVLILSFMWPFGSKDWRQAEKIWRDGMAAEGNPQKEAHRHEWLPYAFLTETPTANVYRIVHDGRLLPAGGGVDALAKYLRDIDAFKRGELTARDMRSLLESFAAAPTTEHKINFLTESLKPTLNRTPDRIEYVVNCVVPDREGRGTHPAPPDEKDVERWTLTIDRQHAAWAKEMKKVKIPPVQ